MSLLASFTVYGVPTGQGSMKAFAVNGKARLAPSGGAKFAAWRNAVAQAAAEAASPGGPLDGPLGLSIVFRFPMPASRRRKNTPTVAYKTTAPDLDKLCRLVADALTASGLVTDDARFCQLSARKVEVVDGWTGAHVEIHRETP